jgi:BASS family bile acid:Na+ symporter
LLVLNYSNASVSLPQAIADPDVDFLVVTFAITAGLCITAFAAAYWLSCLFRTDQADRVSLMYGLGMNNNGTGLVLASLALASFPRVMVPIILYNLVQHLVAGTVHEVTGRNAAVQQHGET